MENGRLDDGVELGASSVEYRELTPAAIGLGIGVERGNGGVESVVQLWEFTPVFMSGLS